MKTIKLHYRVRDYLYPFKTVIIIFETHRVNPAEVELEFSKVFSTLILTSE